MIVQPVKVNVFDEGVSQGFVGEIDFVGSTVAAVVSGNRATVTVSAGGAAGDIAQSLVAPSIDETIAAGSGAYVPDSYELAVSKFLDIGAGSVFEVG